MSRYTERAAYFKIIKRCPRCGKQDSYTITGHSLCYECTEKNREYAKKHYHKYGNNGMKERYEKLKQDGICVDCGKRPAKENRIRCSQCLQKNKKSQQKRQGKKNRYALASSGMCWTCLKRPVAENSKLCDICLSKHRENIKKAQITVQANREQRRMEEVNMALNYNTQTMEKCEYIEAMAKVYFDKPQQGNSKCAGFRNKYNGAISTVCLKCTHFRGDNNDT